MESSTLTMKMSPQAVPPCRLNCFWIQLPPRLMMAKPGVVSGTNQGEATTPGMTRQTVAVPAAGASCR